MEAQWYLQFMIEDCKSKEHAEETLSFLRSQDGFQAGRVMEPRPDVGPGWRVQTFFDDVGAERYPDGVRRVVVLPNLRKELGFPEA